MTHDYCRCEKTWSTKQSRSCGGRILPFAMLRASSPQDERTYGQLFCQIARLPDCLMQRLVAQLRRLGALQLEGLVQRPHGIGNLVFVDDAGDADLAGRDHLDVDAGVEQGAEH